LQLHWQSAPEGKQSKAKKASKRNSHARIAVRRHGQSRTPCLFCGNRYDDGDGDIVVMLAEPSEEGEAD
jgi:hypothetical protein